ncbi:MAG: alpha/beta hydrolase [Phycisphaerae bacterium]|jgi:acetyl esterase/lipase/mRNA-degrading endonuclease RelE of RelBE toxin-antitoxin system|nr:alpha/beta hydrolase [Phycisphaerae bacterium]
MKNTAIAIVVALSVTLSLAPRAWAKKPDKKDAKSKPAAKKEPKQKKLFQIFRESFKDFGKNNTHKVKIISGPTPVKMRNGRVAGKMWRATCGKYRFKMTIEDKTKLPLETLIKRVEQLPMSYIRACVVVSDESEDGLGIYAKLGGAMAHGGKGYINTVPHAPAVVIAHEVGHTLEQAARESDPKLIEKWGAASKADKQSVSGYGDTSDSENLAEFAKVYAVCLDKGPEQLKELKKLSPRRFSMWEHILLRAPAPQRSWSEPLYPGVAPGSKGVKDNEKIVDRNEGKGRPDLAAVNVHKPTLTIHLPTDSKASGAAVIICPGGGYGRCVIGKEGNDVARWLTSIGAAGIVLKYRLPRPEGHVYGHKIPLMDLQRAIRTVRSRAKEWKLKPDRIGVMGFSAGGHLASTAGTHFDSGSPKATDPIDKLSSRPDFMALIYPVVSFSDTVGHSSSRKNLLGDKPDPKLVKLYSNELQVTKDTPPTFLVSTSDDPVKAENSINFYLALRKAKVPAELHVYEQGGHGYGVRRSANPVAGWPQRCFDWMKSRKLGVRAPQRR